MFKLFRYYSIASGIAIIVATVVLVVFYRHDAESELIATAEGQNISLARAFANNLWPTFGPYVTTATERDGDVLRARPETRQIHDRLLEITAGLPVLKVKIYNLEGTTLFSSQPEQIGEDESTNRGFLGAAQEGRAASKLSHRDSFSAFEGRVSNRDLIESYLPIRGPAEDIEGVFELYTDVTPLVIAIDRITIRLVITSLLAFGLLYGVLAFIVRHADRLMERQYLDLQENSEIIRHKNQELEREISVRQRVETALRSSENNLQERIELLEMAQKKLERQGQDLTRLAEDLRLARDMAEKANQSKSEFLATMSHELRTPLNAIIGFSDVMKSEVLGPIGSEQYSEYANDINDAGQHLLCLINDILDLAKVESGKDELCESDIRIEALIGSVVTLVRQRARKESVELAVELGEDIPELRADERKVKQILVNLMTNSIKFTPPGGKVILRSECDAEFGHVFKVIDTGIGIAPDDIPKALSQFGQVDSSLSRKYEGTGLGLPLTKALAELHGGSLDLQSEVGSGTTVTVCFPATRIVRKRKADVSDASDNGTVRAAGTG